MTFSKKLKAESLTKAFNPRRRYITAIRRENANPGSKSIHLSNIWPTVENDKGAIGSVAANQLIRPVFGQLWLQKTIKVLPVIYRKKT